MLLAISFLVYGGLELAPGDAVSHMISPELALSITAEQLDAMREAYGLNKSFLTRYWIWLTSMVQGDMGYSMKCVLKHERAFIFSINKKKSRSYKDRAFFF